MKASNVLFAMFTAALFALMLIRSNTSVLGYYDPDFAEFWVQPYGLLWYALNPFFRSWATYSWTSVLIYAAIVAPQLWLVKRGRLDGRMVVLNVMSAVYFRMAQSTQDMTVIAFAPLASLNPLFAVPLLLQKVAVGFSWNLSDPNWAAWLSATATNPIVAPYYVVLCWLALPPLAWLFRRVEK